MFKHGKTSHRRLEQLAEPLRQVVVAALALDVIDHTVVETLRSDARQAELYAAGASQLDGVRRRSRHQANDAGLSEAVDLYPYLAGKVRVDSALQLAVANTMRDAAINLGVKVRWGGSWTMLNGRRTPAYMLAKYWQRKMSMGSPPFIDMWHFELPPS